MRTSSRLILAVVVLAIFNFAATVPAEDYTYTTNNGTITITKYTGPGGVVDIPGIINGLPVTSIGGGAFESCSSLTSITIPSSVTSIGGGAFMECHSLTSITLSGNLSRIEMGTFIGCGSLTNVTIPNSVTNIGNEAFAICSSLTSVTIPKSVTNIGDGAFAMCISLTSITIPNSVTNIGGGAFQCCTRLSSIMVDSLNNAFSSVEGVLFDENQLTLIACPGGKAGDYVIPNSVTSIGDWAFSGCTSLTSITIPSSVASIGSGDLVFDPVRQVGAPGAFRGCTSLTSITIPNSVTNIGHLAFCGCTSMTNITIPGSVSNWVEHRAIWGDITAVGSFAFWGSGLTTVTIAEGVPYIPSYAFLHCTSLTSIVIPESVTNIGDGSFRGCSSLSNIVIGNGVTNIGGGAFLGCTGMTSVHFQANAPSLGQDVLYANDRVTIYYLPGTIGWGPTYAGRPTAPWLLPYPIILTTAPNFGIQTNVFGFRISWATNVPVVVEASTTLTDPMWTPVSTNTFTDGWSDFSDPDWANHPSRFYRIRSL